MHGVRPAASSVTTTVSSSSTLTIDQFRALFVTQFNGVLQITSNGTVNMIAQPSVSQWYQIYLLLVPKQIDSATGKPVVMTLSQYSAAYSNLIQQAGGQPAAPIFGTVTRTLSPTSSSSPLPDNSASSMFRFYPITQVQPSIWIRLSVIMANEGKLFLFPFLKSN
jgi:hypothetical protein